MYGRRSLWGFLDSVARLDAPLQTQAARHVVAPSPVTHASAEHLVIEEDVDSFRKGSELNKQKWDIPEKTISAAQYFDWWKNNQILTK